MAGIGDQEERGVVHSGDIDEGTHFQFPFQHLPWPASEHQNKDHDDCISDWSGTLFYAAASLLSPVTTRCVRIFPTSTVYTKNGFTTNTRIRGFDLRRSTVSWITRLELLLTASHNLWKLFSHYQHVLPLCLCSRPGLLRSTTRVMGVGLNISFRLCHTITMSLHKS